MGRLPPSNLPNRAHIGSKPSHKPSGGPRKVWALGDNTRKSYCQNTNFYLVFCSFLGKLARAAGARAGPSPRMAGGGRAGGGSPVGALLDPKRSQRVLCNLLVWGGGIFRHNLRRDRAQLLPGDGPERAAFRWVNDGYCNHQLADFRGVNDGYSNHCHQT